MNLSCVQLLSLVVGAVIWAVAIIVVWRRPERGIARLREDDFAQWKAVHGKPEATFAEFLASEEAPGNYLSRGSWTVVISAVALLALHAALRSWSAIP